MAKGRIKLPPELAHLLTGQWEAVLREACLNHEDEEIVRFCLMQKLPMIDAATIIGISRRTIDRRKQDILNRLVYVATKLNY